MKIDDDIFLNVPNLIHFLLGGTIPIYDATKNALKKAAPSEKNRLDDFKSLLIGSCPDLFTVIRTPNSGWYKMVNSTSFILKSSKSSFYPNNRYVPYYMYDKETYPTYLLGGGYIMSIDVASTLYEVSLTIPFFHIEDAFLTGTFPSELFKLLENIYFAVSFRHLRTKGWNTTERLSLN